MVLVVGISGVGKTTLCAAYADARPYVCHLTASHLIASSLRTTVEHLRGISSRSQLMENQRVLSRELIAARRRAGHRPLLLDGQCVIDSGGELVVLPPEEVMSLCPAAIILLEIDLDELLRRRASDGKRRHFRSSDELEEQVEINRRAVSHYAALFGLPWKIVAADRQEFFSAADDLFGFNG